MHGNTPHAGPPEADGDAEPTPERRRALRRELAAVAASTRELLADEFVVGGEIASRSGGLQATVAVRPPGGSVVSAGLGDDAETESVARDLAAGAVVQAKRSGKQPSGAR